ncbi:uncharacterized protein Z518_03872 [Rhinocladiella mackenziei CBS 650.93]|uniref:Phosphoglycerate mutase family protein n=1 Tax=Rhinocladiella mackenziei CBS 650.93 TaxID=1442369 RepID=A0A0D2IJK5_9EURO|nr:uncharacterized protein Z518_03872 [Rhinocladiella mackenziei CBS 650.93]KIX05899.1 hypothetical protein Z518_03872 [Rhinocladiella mackenziei CBS 650.93]
MPSQPRIHLVRHAQGFHNLGFQFHSLPDPKLTPLGESQCAALQANHFPPSKQESISLVTASPLSRTLHTAYLTFAPALANGKCQPKILAIPDAQETSDCPCDTGSDVPVLQRICAEHGWPVDLSYLSEDWNVKTLSNRYSPASEAIKARARDTRLLLRRKARELAENGDEAVEIVLVAHGGYLHYLTDDWENATQHAGTGWENTEFRTYVFESDYISDNDANAYIVETMDSRARRGIDYPMHGHEKQTELYHQMMQGWEDQGLQNPAKIDAVEDNELEAHDLADKEMTLEATAGAIKVMA